MIFYPLSTDKGLFYVLLITEVQRSCGLVLPSTELQILLYQSAILCMLSVSYVLYATYKFPLCSGMNQWQVRFFIVAGFFIGGLHSLDAFSYLSTVTPRNNLRQDANLYGFSPVCQRIKSINSCFIHQVEPCN